MATKTLEAHSGDAGDRPAIDRSVLGEWLADDDTAIDSLLVIFRDSAHAEYARLLDALSASDLDEYARAAHRLRGTAVSMGAPGLAAAAAAIDDAAKRRDSDACMNAMPDLAWQIRLVAAEVPGDPPPLETLHGGNRSGFH